MTLSALSDQIRKIYKWGLLALALIFFLWFGWFIISSLSNLIFKPVGDDIAYGKLAPPIFTRTFQRVKSENFILETKLPKTTKNPKAQVFKIEDPVGINEEEQEKLTRGLGLVGEEKTSSGNVITWKHRNGTKLTINTRLGHVEYDFNYGFEQGVLAGKITSSENDLLDKAATILRSRNLLPGDIDKKNTALKFFFIQGTSKKQSAKASSNALEISYFRKVDSKTSVGDPTIRLLLSQNGNRILELDYFYSLINAVGSPYPIISADQAWGLLKEGKAFAQTRIKYSTVKLKGLRISYWESHFSQPYLQPVWVFSLEGVSKEGSASFTAFISAIEASYLTSQQ